MTVWLLAALMTAAAVAAIVIPLLRARRDSVDSAAYDIEVYKDQLGQIDRDHERGLFTAQETQAAKTEIARRLIAADERLQRAGQAPDATERGSAPLAVVAVLILVPAVALGIYAMRGNPDLPGLTFAERADERAPARAEAGGTDLATAAATLASRLAQQPDDLPGWTLLARTYASLGRHREAAGAYARALGLDESNAALSSAYGEALFMAAEGVVTPAARAAFEGTLAREPEDARARYYLGIADSQAGRKQAAIDRWATLMAESAADAPWIPALRQRIAEAAGELGLDAAAVTPEPQPAGTDGAGLATSRAAASLPPAQPADGPSASVRPGPTAADIAAAEAMSPEERQQMVRGMVDGLAQRLEESPRDFEGWVRLIRAYAVLEERAKAEAALGRAMTVFAEAPFPTQQLAALAGELDLALPGGARPPAASSRQPAETSSGETSPGGTGGTARGPTAEDMAAAQEMSPEERQQMIRGMVEGLAQRLESEPGDAAGWMQLARSYNVLGESEKARDALARATEAAPDNVDVLILYGRAERALNGDQPTEASLAAMRRVLERNPGHVEALWFVGGAEAAAGNAEAARSLWEKALAALPPGSPERAELRRRIDTLGR